MSQNTATHYAYDAQYQRYKLLRFDYTSREWKFSQWMQPGWVPSQPSSEGQAIQTTTSISSGHSRNDSGQTVSSAYGASSYPATSAAVANSHYNQQWPYGSPGTMQSPYQSNQPTQSAAGSLSQPYGSHATSTTSMPYTTQQYVHDSTTSLPKGKGSALQGTHGKHEEVDNSYYVRNVKFFAVGRVLAVIMSESAGENAIQSNAMDYNSAASINPVKYKNNYVYTNVRRLVVVRKKREFCYACPIFTYGGRATTKKGVRPDEHGIAYSSGYIPQLVSGESGIIKPSIEVEMAANANALQQASRIYYGIIHPIQYNVKVKDIGSVLPTHVPYLIGNWKAEDKKDAPQAHDDTADINEEDEDEDEDVNDTVSGAYPG